MALAGMPAINGRGIAIGVGSFDGESAFAVGFQIQGEMASFQIGVTSSGGETGASAGVGFQF
jgi:autotransporter adhesin